MKRVLLVLALVCGACSASSPSDDATSAHGRLLRYVRVPGAVSGATTYRIRYTSFSITNKPIEVTGVAVIPTAKAPSGGRVVLSSAHGTTGIADQCAPSRARTLGEATALGPVAVRNGWILAATDYEGLGTPGRHPYLVGQSEGRSVLDAARAAAQLPDAHASRRLLIAGYSQGGHAAAWANQIAPKWTPAFDVLGTFSGAPVSEIHRILAAGRTLPIQAFVALTVAGYEAAYPDVRTNGIPARPDTYLTPAGLQALGAVDHGCLSDVEAALRSIAPSDLVLPNGPTDPTWQLIARANNPGEVKGGGPVLIVHSAEDDVVPAELSRLMRARMCAHGQVVERRVIHAGGHIAAVPQAFTIGLQWLQARARNAKAVNDCRSTTDSDDGR